MFRMTIRSYLLLPLLIFAAFCLSLLAIFLLFFNPTISLSDPSSSPVFWIVLVIVISGPICVTYYFSHRLAASLQQLNQLALQIASGDEIRPISKASSCDLKELGQTLVAIGASFDEFKHYSSEQRLSQARMYGENESAALIQQLMLERVVEQFHHPALAIRLIPFPISTTAPGLLLKIDFLSSNQITIRWIEALSSGIAGLVALNQTAALPIETLSTHSYLECSFETTTLKLHWKNHNFPSPFIWVKKQQTFLKGELNVAQLEVGDLLFFVTPSYQAYFPSQNVFKDWLERILVHFADEGLEALITMASRELYFIHKQLQLPPYLQILCLQVRPVLSNL